MQLSVSCRYNPSCETERFHTTCANLSKLLALSKAQRKAHEHLAVPNPLSSSCTRPGQVSCNSAALKTGTALRAQAAQQALAVSAARYCEHLSRQKFATSAVGSRGGGERELERGLIRLRQIELEHARALSRGEAGPSRAHLACLCLDGSCETDQ